MNITNYLEQFGYLESNESSLTETNGNFLTHGFFPNNDECLGIHFDKSENWYFGESSNTPDGQINFYTVLADPTDVVLSKFQYLLLCFKNCKYFLIMRTTRGESVFRRKCKNSN
jgi:hypothetical protein